MTAAARLPTKRTSKIIETRGKVDDDGGVSVGVSVSDSELGYGEGADQFGRHRDVVGIPESVRADGSKTRARKSIVYTS